MARKPLLDNPMLHVCGSADPYLEEHTHTAEQRYLAPGGKMEIIVQERAEHYPLNPTDPAAAVAFILESLISPGGIDPPGHGAASGQSA